MVTSSSPARSRGRPKAELSLTDEERSALERLIKRRTSAQAMALRARIILSCATGAPNAAVAGVLGVAPATVGKWRRRFVAARLDGLFDEPRPGAPRKISDDQVEAVIVKTLEAKPRDATHWSTRSMAKAMGMSQTSISLIWRAFGLQPHRAESFKLSTDPCSSRRPATWSVTATGTTAFSPTPCRQHNDHAIVRRLLIVVASDGKEIVDDVCAKKAVAELTREQRRSDGGVSTERCRHVPAQSCRIITK